MQREQNHAIERAREAVLLTIALRSATTLHLTSNPLLAVFGCTHKNAASDEGSIAEGDVATDVCECDSGVIIMGLCVAPGKYSPPPLPVRPLPTSGHTFEMSRVQEVISVGCLVRRLYVQELGKIIDLVQTLVE